MKIDFKKSFITLIAGSLGFSTFLSLKAEDAPDLTWLKLLGTSSTDEGHAVSTASDGSIYITGNTQGDLDGETNAGGYDAFLTKYSSDGTLTWTKLLGTSSTEIGYGVATASDGSVYASGWTRGNLDGETNAGSHDAFLTKYSSDGTLTWTKLLGTSTVDQSRGVAVANDGSVYSSGLTRGALDGETNAGSYYAFLTKYGSDGTKIWTKLLGTSSNLELSYGVATASDGSVYTAGITYGDLGGETNAGASDAFLTKYSSDGTLVWTKLIGGAGSDRSLGISTASDGSIYITGHAGSDFDGEVNAGAGDAFLTKYSSDGTKVWTNLIGTTQVDYGYGVATASDGSIFIAGYTLGDLDGETNAGQADVYVQKYSSDGTLVWTKLVGSSDADYGIDISTASDGSIYISGYTYGDLNGETNAGSADVFLFKLENAFVSNTNSGYATYSITGTRAAGNVLTAAISSDDPDGNGTVSSYQWQSSADGSTDWTAISGATSSTYTLTESEEGKYVRVIIVYTDGSSNETTLTVTLGSPISEMHTEWLQPYAAMQNIGLKSIHNNRDLVLEKAGECNNNGWVIGDSDYCLYTNANNIVSYVNGDTTKGSYGSAVFNSSLNLEKTLNDKWKAGIAYGVGSSNLNKFDFSNTTASLSSTNTHYSIYGVKKVNDIFTLKGIIGGSDFDYKGKRNYSTTSATSSYDSDGYTAEINGTWDIKKRIKNMKTPFNLKPSVGVAYAAHTQDGFSESGSGDLITIDANQAESLLFKTGISIDKQIPMEGGKWLLVPSLALNYEMDTYADDSHRSIKGGLTESSTEHTSVSAKTFGQHNGSLEVGADFVLTKDFMFNLKAEYGLAEGGDEHAYGGGFRWQF